MKKRRTCFHCNLRSSEVSGSWKIICSSEYILIQYISFVVAIVSLKTAKNNRFFCFYFIMHCVYYGHLNQINGWIVFARKIHMGLRNKCNSSRNNKSPNDKWKGQIVNVCYYSAITKAYTKYFTWTSELTKRKISCIFHKFIRILSKMNV